MMNLRSSNQTINAQHWPQSNTETSVRHTRAKTRNTNVSLVSSTTLIRIRSGEISNMQSFALVITFGRSGSTLLQGILNSAAGVHIAGENNNFLYGLFLSQRALSNAVDRDPVDDETKPTSPWFARTDLDLEQFQEDCSELAKKTLFPKHHGAADYRILGFKEIRYLDLLLEGKSIHHLSKYVDFLTSIFAPCKIITLTRQHKQVLKSSWWRYHNDKANLLAKLHAFDAWMLQHHRENTDSHFHLDYRDLTLGSPNINELFEFLDLEVNHESLKLVLNTEHSIN